LKALMNTNPVISINGLSKMFGSLTAVDNISFDILKGEVFGFLGPNGAGKTTTINMVCGLMPASGGQIDYTEHGSQKISDVKSIIGYCPQENIYFPKLTCREQLVFMGNIYGMPQKTSKKRADKLLDQLGLAEKSSVLAQKLSGGMKRRLSICHSLIHDPEILVLDEPEAGLDPQSRLLVREFILSFANEKTIILTTHNMDEADRLADRVAIIDHGKLLLIDTPENLKKTIGTGDILEIEVNQGHEEKLASDVKNLSEMCEDIKISDSSLIIRSKNILEIIPQITDRLNTMQIGINEMKLRETTLEDVFIHLTGRRLRQ
jgi:ABC-2 type transport system ATP-binding protein